MGYRMGVVGTVVVEGAAAAPERPNNKDEAMNIRVSFHSAMARRGSTAFFS